MIYVTFGSGDIRTRASLHLSLKLFPGKWCWISHIVLDIRQIIGYLANYLISPFTIACLADYYPDLKNAIIFGAYDTF